MMVIIYSLMIVALAFLGVYTLLRVEHSTTPTYPKTPWMTLKFTPEPAFNRESLEFSAQSKAWRDQLSSSLSSIKKAQIKHIILVHGTFVGDDPFGIITLLEHYKKLPEQALNQMKIGHKNRNNKFLGDRGNFTDSYIKLLEQASQNELNVINFTWSSGNNHLARLQGAVDLMARIQNTQGHILLIGHSHASQLFALMTQLISQGPVYQPILKALQQDPLILEIQKYSPLLKGRKLDFVTLGAPPRYPYYLTKDQRLLNLINHRGHQPIAGKISGLLSTRDGDYIQQYGVEGSDTITPHPQQARTNKRLDSALGVGAHLSHWVKTTKKKQRVPEDGETILIDYQDHIAQKNAFKTIFGHGIYTTYDSLLFQINLIVNRFYK